MSARSYTVGVPVTLTVDDAGRVTIEVDLGDVDVRSLEESVAWWESGAQVSADWERIEPAIEVDGSRAFRVVPEVTA